MASWKSDQSGGELRMQDGDSGSRQWNLETRSQVSIGVCFGRENWPLDSKAWDQSFHIFSPRTRESIYIHVNQMRNNCIYLKNPNSLQEGTVSNLQIRCVMLVNVIFLSIKLYYHWSLLSYYVVAPKEAIFLFKVTYCSRSESISFMSSEGYNSYFTLLLYTPTLHSYLHR